MNRLATLILIALLVLSGLVMVEAVSAQSYPTPSVPEFTVEFSDNSYDVPPSYEIDSYTGENVTVDGYHVENKTIQLTIKNQPHSSSYDYFYNVRVKNHFSENWKYLFPSMYSIQMLDSEYTIVSFSSSGGEFHGIWGSSFEAPSVGELDFQVQAFVGYMDYHIDGWTFETVDSDWSDTQTLTNSSPSPEPTPTSSPFSLTPTSYDEPQLTDQQVILGFAVTVAVLAVGLGLLVYLIKRK